MFKLETVRKELANHDASIEDCIEVRNFLNGARHRRDAHLIGRRLRGLAVVVENATADSCEINSE